MRVIAPANRSAILRQVCMGRRVFRGGGETRMTRSGFDSPAIRTMKMPSACAYTLALQLGDEEGTYLVRELRRDVAQDAALVRRDVARRGLPRAAHLVGED